MTIKVKVYMRVDLATSSMEHETILKAISNSDADNVHMEPLMASWDESVYKMNLDWLHASNIYIGIFRRNSSFYKQMFDELNVIKTWKIERWIYVIDSQVSDHPLQDQLEVLSDPKISDKFKTIHTVEDFCKDVNVLLDEFVRKLLQPSGSFEPLLIERASDTLHLPTKLVGRNVLFKKIIRLLNKKQRVLLHGIGGIGKTALAATVVANHLNSGRARKVIWSEVGDESPSVLFEALARLFGATENIAKKTGDSQILSMKRILAGSGVSFLVLDNVDNSETLYKISQAIPENINLLITSQQKYPEFYILPVDRLGITASRQLVEIHAQKSYRSFQGDLDELCKILSYNPLALKIAGQNLMVDKLLPLQLLNRIRDTPHELESPYPESGYGDEGKRKVDRIFYPSLNVLDTNTQNLFLAFGALFSTRHSIDLLSIYMDKDHSEIERSLEALRRRGLIELIPETKNMHVTWRMDDLAYAFVRSKNTDTQRIVGLKSFIAYIKKYNPNDRENFRFILTELDSVLAGVRWAKQSKNYGYLDQLVHHLCDSDSIPFLSLHGYYAQYIELLKDALHVAEIEGRFGDQAQYLASLGNTYSKLADLENAKITCELGSKVARQAADRSIEAGILDTLAAIYRKRGEFTPAIEHCNMGLIIAREGKFLDREADLLGTLGSIYKNMGNLETALDHQNQALTIARKIKNKRSIGARLNDLGLIYISWGRHQEGVPFFTEALAIYRELYYKLGEGEVLGNLGIAFVELKKFDEALSRYEESLKITQEIGDKENEASQLGNIANVYFYEKTYGRALQYCLKAVSMAQELGLRRLEINLRNSLGAIYEAMGEHVLALKTLQEGLIIAGDSKTRHYEAYIMANIGDVYDSLRKYNEAISYYESAKSIILSLGFHDDVKNMDVRLAEIRDKLTSNSQ